MTKFPRTSNPLSTHLSEFQLAVLRSLMPDARPHVSSREIISWFTRLKTRYSLEVTPANLDQLTDWKIGKMAIHHKDGKYFEVVGHRIQLGRREVKEWYQPFMRPVNEGLIGFVVKEIDGVLHLLVQAKLEVGNFDVLEMAPTVQCLTGSYKDPEYPVPFLDVFLQKKGTVHFDTIQSEEGGRFFQEQNRNMIVEAKNDFPIPENASYIWMTFRQAKEFIRFNNYFNVQARNLIACICPV